MAEHDDDDDYLSVGDERTIYTASDALVCKYSASSLGYYNDKYLHSLFAKSIVKANTNSMVGAPSINPLRKPPIINRGYYGRVKCIDVVLSKFLSATSLNTSIASIPSIPTDIIDKLITDIPDSASAYRQIVSLGGGFDTLSLRIIAENNPGLHIYEVDFEEVINKKAVALLSESTCRHLLLGNHGNNTTPSASPGIKDNRQILTKILHDCTITNGYNLGPNLTLFGSDLRNNTNDIINKLTSIGFNPSLPTLILTECVLVYIEKAVTEQLINTFASSLSNVAWDTYDMVNPTDSFGKTMCRNLRDAGFNIPGFLEYPTIESQIQRFQSNKFEKVNTMSMLAAYQRLLTSDDKMRIARIEHLDEIEEFELIMSHYTLTTAVKGSVLSGLV